MKINRKHALCEGVNTFLGNNYGIYVRAKGVCSEQMASFSAWVLHFVAPPGHSVKFSSQVKDLFLQLGELAKQVLDLSKQLPDL